MLRHPKIATAVAVLLCACGGREAPPRRQAHTSMPSVRAAGPPSSAAPSAVTSSTIGATPVPLGPPTQFTSVRIIQWFGGEGFANARLGDTPVVLKLKLQQKSKTFAVTASHKGEGGHIWNVFPSHGQMVVTTHGGKLLLYRDNNTDPVALSGRKALFSPDGKTIVTHGDDAVYVTSVADPSQTTKFGTAANVGQLTFVDNGRWLVATASERCAVGSGDQGVVIIDLQARKKVLDVAAASSTMSPSGRYVAATTAVQKQTQLAREAPHLGSQEHLATHQRLVGRREHLVELLAAGSVLPPRKRSCDLRVRSSRRRRCLAPNDSQCIRQTNASAP